METKYFARKCDNCGKGMNEGYLADDEYYCSEPCLRTQYTEAEWLELYDDGESDYFYWTDWGEDMWSHVDDEVYLADGTAVAIAIDYIVFSEKPRRGESEYITQNYGKAVREHQARQKSVGPNTVHLHRVVGLTETPLNENPPLAEDCLHRMGASCGGRS